MATPTPATRSELMKFMKKSVAPEDNELLDDTLEAATEAAEGWHMVGPIVVREFTERVRADTGILMLPKTPVQSVTSATRVTDGLEYLTAALDVDGKSGAVSGVDETIPDGDYIVVFSAGRDPVPVSLKTAVLIIADHNWSPQRGPTTNRFRGAEQETSARVSHGYLIPYRAASLLQDHALVP